MQILNPDQSQLMARARAALRVHGFESHYGASSGPERDALLTIRGHGKTRTFIVEERRSVEPRTAGLHAWSLAAMAASQKWSSSIARPLGSLIVTEYVDEVTAAGLWAEDINFLDAAGNANIDLGGLRVEVSGRRLESGVQDNQRRDQAVKAPEAGAFSAAGLPISLLLLSRPDVVASDPTMREVASLVPSSLGKVQEVVSGLREAGLLSTGHGAKIVQGRRWLNAWTEGYLRHRHKWHDELRFLMPGAVTMKMLADSSLTIPGAWLGGETAVSQMGLPLRPSSAMIYAEDKSTVVRALKLRRDPGGKVEVAQPLWLREGWPGLLAPPVVIRADLIASGDPRQAEMAEEMEKTNESLRLLFRGK